MKNYTERQAHAFEFEEYIIQKFNLEVEPVYTHEWDAYYKNIPVSIKYQRKGTNIELGDINRQRTKTKSFILIVGFWDYTNLKNEEKVAEEIYFLYINLNFWRQQFPLSCSDIMDPSYVFKGISNSRQDDEKWIKRWKGYKEIWSKEKTIIDIHYKRDHKTQKRIQCSIKNADFFEVLLPYYKIISLDEFFV